MSVNQRYSINQEKVSKWGKYYGGIDFEVASVNKEQLNFKGNSVTAGEFVIAERKYKCSLDDLDSIIDSCKMGKCSIRGNEYDCTESELNRIIETCFAAKNVFFQKYRFAL